MATRRAFLAGAASLAFVPPAISSTPALPRLMSAAHVAGRDQGALWRGGTLTPFALPARAHALNHLPDNRILLTGRRPGYFATSVDAANPGVTPRDFVPSQNACFAGHAAISPDGTCLATAELDRDSIEAFVVTRDPRSGTERARFQPGGLEPHEVIFARHGARLVVAIGGLRADGGIRGPIFDPQGVKSAVVELDPKSGRVLARHTLPTSLASVSLRHLAVTPDGETLVVAAQDQDLSEARPLMALLRLGGKLELLPQPAPNEADFRGYIGAIAIDKAGAYVAAASPRGGVLGVWSVPDGKWRGGVAIADVCGVANGTEPGTFWVSSGHGAILQIAMDIAGPRIVGQWHTEAGFDNHMLLV